VSLDLTYKAQIICTYFISLSNLSHLLIVTPGISNASFLNGAHLDYQVLVSQFKSRGSMPAKAYLIRFDKYDPRDANTIPPKGTNLRVAGKAEDIMRSFEALRVLHGEVVNNVTIVMRSREKVGCGTFRGPQLPRMAVV
jgi:hypothetical protein